MNTIITSKDNILDGAKKLIADKGLSALDMRSLASFLHISVGSLYNYFPSKEALIEESVGAVFKDIFHSLRSDENDFLSLVDSLHQALIKGEEKYPGFFSSHSLFFAKSGKSEASQMKLKSQEHIKEQMKEALKKDPKISPKAFEGMSRDGFTDLVFTSLLYTYLEKKDEIKDLEEMIRRIIY